MTQPTKPETPELNKLIQVSGDSQEIGQFLEWLNEIGYRLCLYDHDEEAYLPTFESINGLLSRYFGVDLDKVETERRAVLEYARALNADH